jgi:hypothetical protein
MKPSESTRRTITVVMVSIACFLSACSSTLQRTGIVTAGAAGGAAIGYGVKRTPAAAAIGGVAGAGLTALALGSDNKVRQEGIDQGYALGNSDASKRLYWLKQAQEKHNASAAGTRTSYYVFSGPQDTADGQRLVPHQVVVPILEPVDNAGPAPDQEQAEQGQSEQTQP